MALPPDKALEAAKALLLGIGLAVNEGNFHDALLFSDVLTTRFLEANQPELANSVQILKQLLETDPQKAKSLIDNYKFVVQEIIQLSKNNETDKIRDFVNSFQNLVSKLAMGKAPCPFCGALVKLDANFCGYCGKQIKHPCPGCQHPIPVTARFCGFCGLRQAA